MQIWHFWLPSSVCFTVEKFDEVKFQFVLCELSKAERYIDGGSVIYERSHHEHERV